MNSSMQEEEEDPRSIKIRKVCKRLHEYLDILNDANLVYPLMEKLDIFDDIFLSFLKEEDFNTCSTALELLIQRVDYYSLELANYKIAMNIGKMLDCYLKKFKNQFTESKELNLHKILSKITSDSSKMRSLRDTEYVIALVFLKHFDPVLYKKEGDQMLARLDNFEGTDSFVTNLINLHYQYPNDKLNDLINFEFRSIILIKNTMIVTEDFIKKTIDFLSDDYRDAWITIYANKMLAHLIVPFVAYSQNEDNRDNVQVDDKKILEWLLRFSKKSFGHKVRPDKWENIYEEDFALTWQFVREHASKKERRNFYKYLIDNGFEFHLSDPLSESCYKGVTNN